MDIKLRRQHYALSLRKKFQIVILITMPSLLNIIYQGQFQFNFIALRRTPFSPTFQWMLLNL